jgi:hypothetical protein
LPFRDLNYVTPLTNVKRKLWHFTVSNLAASHNPGRRGRFR